jgi:predicted DNA-binding transcriptional regulator YafY
MPITKNAWIRYKTLDRCFRSRDRDYDIKALLEACEEAMTEVDYQSNGIQKRQLYKDIKFMESIDGYSAELEKYRIGKKVYYRYMDKNFSILQQPLNAEEETRLNEALLTLSRLEGIAQFDWIDEMSTRLKHEFNLDTDNKVMSFDENFDLKGRNHLGVLFKCIVRKDPIKLSYEPFHHLTEQELIIHPYYLKQYNNRWFLFGFDHDLGKIANIALDRIKSKEIQLANVEYIPNTTINFDEYFEDVVGVSIPSENNEIQKIVLKINKQCWPYIETKPFHATQTKISNRCTSDHTVICLQLILNYELKARILSYGADVQVLEPESYKLELKQEVEKMLNLYRD